ncbi:MAG: lipase maturation factor family protein, partial [Phycisphaerales bacterium]
MRELTLAFRRDFPSFWRRMFLIKPSLFWISDRDWFISAVAWLGAAASLASAWGVPALGAWPMVIAAITYRSLDLTISLSFPWDCVISEVSVFAAFLPALPPLLASTSASTLSLSIAASQIPHPLAAFQLRFMLSRLMLAFAKTKFIGCGREDLGYLKPFYVMIPMPSRLGFLSVYQPMVAHIFGLFMMFVIEVPVPLMFAFGWGRVRLAAAALTALLQVMIQLTGNFGFFNLLTALLAVPLLDASRVVPFFEIETFTSWPALTLLTLLLLPAQLYCFVFTSWVT